MTNNGLNVIPFVLAVLAQANLFWQIVELTCSLSSYANLVRSFITNNPSSVTGAPFDSHTPNKHPNTKCTRRNCVWLVMLLSLRFIISTIAITLAAQSSLLASLNVCESVPPSLDLTLPLTSEMKIFPRVHNSACNIFFFFLHLSSNILNERSLKDSRTYLTTDNTCFPI